ncbi:MAG: hypothetical protein WCL57_15835 [Chloroflexota bacterium]
MLVKLLQQIEQLTDDLLDFISLTDRHDWLDRMSIKKAQYE